MRDPSRQVRLNDISCSAAISACGHKGHQWRVALVLFEEMLAHEAPRLREQFYSIAAKCENAGGYARQIRVEFRGRSLRDELRVDHGFGDSRNNVPTLVSCVEFVVLKMLDAGRQYDDSTAGCSKRFLTSQAICTGTSVFA